MRDFLCFLRDRGRIGFRFFQVFSGSFGVGELVVGVVAEFELDDLVILRGVGAEFSQQEAELAVGGVEVAGEQGFEADDLLDGEGAVVGERLAVGQAG